MATLDMSASAQYRRTPFTRFIRRYGPPDDFPLWQGEVWTPSTSRFAVAVPKTYENDEMAWGLTITTSAPGMRRQQRVRLEYEFDALAIIPQ